MHGVAGPPVLSWLFNENLGSLMNSLESLIKICGSPMKKLGSPIMSYGFLKSLGSPMIKALGVSNENLGVSDEMNVGHGPSGSPNILNFFPDSSQQ